MKKLLPRRTFLRGCLGSSVLALGLPPLEAMLNTNGLYANGSNVDTPIFGVFFWANGMPWHTNNLKVGHNGQDLWTPSATGANFPSSPLLQPLERHGVNVVTGLSITTEIPTVGFPGGQADGHMRGFMVALTGERPEEHSFNHDAHLLTAKRPSLDQYVAKHPNFYGKETPLRRSIELGVSRARFHDYGHWNDISYNGPMSTNSAVTSPSTLYNTLFHVDPDREARQRLAVKQGRMLDLVLADAQRLKKRLGARDRARLDEHLSHISTIENRLIAGAQLQCSDPGAPSIDTPSRNSLHPATSIMASLLAAALRCDMSRVFSFMLTSPGSTHGFDDFGVGDMHAACHDGNWEGIRRVTEHQMQAFALLLDALKEHPDPVSGRTLFDRSTIYATSEYGEGWKHNVHQMPMIIAGGGNGRLANRTHVHVQDNTGNNEMYIQNNEQMSICKAQLTVLKSLGLPDTSFGWSGGGTSSPIGELLI